MKTYNDLLEATTDYEKGVFIEQAVNSFMTTDDYKLAVIADKYYSKHNVTIENFKKWIYSVSGRRFEDIYSANYKLKRSFFRIIVIQTVQYLLANGVNLKNQSNKDKLGKRFDKQLQHLAKIAMVEGRGFGYWNHDHLEVFGYAMTDRHAGFCPLYDEDTAKLKAGIRFRYKKVGDTLIKRYTLFEADGITEFIKRGNDDVEILTDKKAYKTKIVKNEAEGIVDVFEENYNGLFPIVPLYANDLFVSELDGLREEIDAFDLIRSGLCNNIDDTSELFWTVSNAGGMQDTDLAKLLQRIKTLHSAVVDEDVKIEPHEVSVPVDARDRMLQILRADIFEDAMLMDVKAFAEGGDKTTVEIKSAYQMQDSKCDDFEYYILDFLDSIFELAGINDEATLTRGRIVNQLEETNMILSASNYLSPETIINKLPFLTSDEKVEAIKYAQSEMIHKFTAKKEVEEIEEIDK